LKTTGQEMKCNMRNRKWKTTSVNHADDMQINTTELLKVEIKGDVMHCVRRT